MGGRESDLVLLDENGIRCDGRRIDETRKISIKAGVLKNANGSAYIEFGDNKILAGVFGPRDVHPNTWQILIQEYYVVDTTCLHFLLVNERTQLPLEEKLK